MITLGIIIYALIAAGAARPIAGAIAWSLYYHRMQEYKVLYRGQTSPAPDQWIGATLLAIVASVAWPLLVAALVANHTTPAIGAEKRAQLESREARIRNAERELGL